MRLLLALESENFPEQRRALRAPGLPPRGRLGSPIVPPREIMDRAGGALLLVDWARGAVCTRLDAPQPGGLAWPDPDGPIWIGSLRHGELWGIEPESGEVCARWGHPAYNDLHRMTPRPGGGMFVVASGTDCVVALEADGREAWAWWGDASVDQTRCHAADAIPTLSRTIHPISIAALSRDRALVTSFHLGTIFELDRGVLTKTHLSGLQQPHGLVRTAGGWMVADTGRGRILRLDDALQITAVLAEGFRWLQDLAPLPGGGVLVVENKDFRGSDAGGGPRVLELDAQGREVARLSLSPDWRLSASLLLDEARAGRISWPGVRVRSRYRRSPPAGTGSG